MFSKQGTGTILIIASSLFYASYGIWTVLMGDFFGGYTASALRSVLVVVILFFAAYAWNQFEPIEYKQNKKQIWGMIIASMFVWGPLYYSILQIGIGLALAINYAAIVLGLILFGRILEKEPITVSKIVSASIGIVGLVMILVPSLQGGLSALPFAAAIVSGLAIGLNMVWAKQLSYKTTQSAITLWIASVIANIPLAFLLQEPIPSVGLHIEWLYLVIFAVSSVFSSWLLLAGMRYIDAGWAGILGLSEIVFAVLFGVLLFSERLDFVSIIGIILILAAATVPYFTSKLK